MNFTVAATALVERPGHGFLAVKAPDADRGWELPGGHLEEGEALLEGVAREVREESGVEIDLGPLFAVYSNLTHSRIIFAFLATYRSGELTTSEESVEVLWLPAEELKRRLQRQMILDRALDGLSFDRRVRHVTHTVEPYEITYRCFMDNPGKAI